MNYLKEDEDEGFQWEGAEVIGEVVSNPALSSFQLLEGQQQQTTATLDLDKSNWGPEEIAAYALLRSKRKKCIVSGCSSRSIPLARSYHQLPVRNLEVWQKWVEAIRWSKNEPEWLPSTDQPLVCSRHFHPVSDFVSYEGSSRSRLNHTAVPTLFLDPPEGTIMDSKFSEEREPPQFVPFTRYRSSTSNLAKMSNGNINSHVMPPIHKYPASTVNMKQMLKVEKKEPREYMEITPEFNFEETSEYDGEMTYGPESPEEEDGIDGYEEQIGYNNNTESFSRSQNAEMFYPDTDMTEQEGTEEYSSYPQQPQVFYRNRQQQPAAPVGGSKPKLISISSLLGNMKSADKKKPQQAYSSNSNLIQQQMARRGFRPNHNNNNTIARNGGRGPSAGGSNIKIERMGGSMLNNFPRKILMKVPPAKFSGSGSSTGPTQKHKIGMSKCRLIIESIEQQLEIELQAIKQRVAQEMDVPTQVVNGVWQIKDKIKKGNNS